MEMTPKWLSCYINKSEVESLAKKVGELEKGTSVEIVTMVVEKSSVKRHVFWFLVIASYSILYAAQREFFWDLSFQLATSMGLLVVSVLAAWGLNRLFPHFFTRLFTDDRDLETQVLQRAQVEFHNKNLSATSGHTGVLIFISILERCVVVLADKHVSEKLPKETWKQVVQNLSSDLKRRDLAKGLIRAVEDVSKLVTPLFPAHNDNPNELTDHLIIAE